MFKRHDSKVPERGGWKKDTGGATYAAVVDRLKADRKMVDEVTNRHLACHGHDQRVDHRSHKDRGIDTVPGKHYGPKRIWSQQRASLLDADERRGTTR